MCKWLPLVLGAVPALLSAEEIQGRITRTWGWKVEIRLEGDLLPQVGDPLLVFQREAPGLEGVFLPKPVAEGDVETVEGEIVVAEIDDESDEKPGRGQRVTIQSERPANVDPIARAKGAHDPLAGEPPTETQAAEFGHRIEVAFPRDAGIALEEAVDPEALFARAVGDATLSDSIREEIHSAFDEVPLGGMALLSPARLPRGCKHLRVRVVDGEARPLFRCVGDDGISYIELVLRTDARGSTRVVDVYNCGSGELFSETIRRAMVPGAEGLRLLNELKAPTPGDLVLGIDGDPIAVMARLRSEGKAREALEHFDKNADRLKEIRAAHVVRIAAAGAVGDEELRKAVAEARAAFAKDASVELLAAGGFLARKQSDLAIEALDRLDEAIGGDPSLDVLRSIAHEDAGRVAEARTCAARVTEQEPSLDDGWWTRAGIALRQHDFKDVVLCLEGGEKHLDWEGDELSSEPGFDEFVKSEEYRAWMEKQEK